jgi:hypothetical protein
VKNRKILFVIIIVSFLLSCGRKGDPFLETKKLLPVSEIFVVQRGNKLELNWKYPDTETTRIKGFRILKANIKDNKSNDLQTFRELTFLGRDSRNFIDDEIKEEETYLYKIVVVSQNERFSMDSPIINVKPLPPLQAPIGIKYSLKNDFVEIRWHPLDLAKYYIYKSYERGNYKLPLNNLPLKDNSFKDKIEKKRVVYYAIKAIRDDGLRIESPLSEDIEVNPNTFVPTKPKKPTSVISEKGVYLIWDENPETWINGYRVYRKDEEESEFKLIGDTLLPTFLDKELIKSKRAYYVTAIGPSKESTPSDILEVYPLAER